MADNKKPDADSEPVNEEFTDAVPLEEPKADVEELAAETLPEEPEAEITEATEPAPQVITQRVVEKRSVFIPAVLGGVIAAGLGFAAAKTDFVEGYLPISKADQVVAGLEQALAEQSKQIEALKTQISELQIPDLSDVDSQMTALTTQISPLSTSIEGLETRLTTLNTSLTELSDRVTAVEKRPISEGISQSAIDAYENELGRLQESMVAQRAEVEAMIEAAKAVGVDAKQTHADAADVLRIAASNALLADLRAALASGAPYATQLRQLETNGATIPQGLAASADTGVTTLAALQDSYPDVARAALSAARDTRKDTDKGFGAFIRRQLGARSVSPRDGDDADAVLSRAEAALIDGQVSVALEELSALPEDVKATMADWIEPAQIRLAAITASNALGRELNTK